MGLCLFAEALVTRAELNADVSDIDDALTHLYKALAFHPPNHAKCAYNLGAIAEAFQARFKLSQDPGDLNQATEYYTAGVEHTASPLRVRSLVAGQWINFAYACGHQSALTGYQIALGLLQQTLALDPMLELQHRFIKSTPHLQVLPCDAMAAALQFGEIDTAIKMLEQGRGALWAELHGLRSPLHGLEKTHPALAARLRTNRHNLEVLSTTSERAAVPVLNTQESTSAGYDNIRYHNRLLLEEQDSILSEIRSLPGFANFAGGNFAVNLQEVAAEGPVIVVNLSEKRSDIVILVHDKSPACLPLPDTFISDVTALVAHLQEGRAGSYKQFNRALQYVLRETWDLIGAPVIRKLKELQVAKGSRIWWCPTGILCFRPLHAAGPISPKSSRHLLDLYVSSYTPTLIALLDARKNAPVPSSPPAPPKILIVAQSDATLPTVELEVATIASLTEDITCLLSDEASKSAVTAHLQSHPWVHFACHGRIHPSQRFASSFLLANAEHLTLLDIARIKSSPDSSRELAFLSACHSAGAPHDSAYEVLQLSTAMQFCGYRSVVGTMWAMVDADGADVARAFYEYMFSKEEGACEEGFRRSARAICEAAKQLGRQRADLERWVNFIHIGT